MTRIASTARSFARGTLLAGACLVPLFAAAQSTVDRPPPRSSPGSSETTRIPEGVDTGSPTTSNAMPLGTPVPPTSDLDRVDSRTHSAAARAAARRDPLTKTGAPSLPAPLLTDDVRRDASRPAVVSTLTAPRAATATVTTTRTDCVAPVDSQFRLAMSRCSSMTDRDARAQCASRASDTRTIGSSNAVSLPGTGFVGSTASPASREQVARGSARVNCI